MQITIDTAKDDPATVRAILSHWLGSAVIPHADNPSTGTIAELTADLPARAVRPPPTLTESLAAAGLPPPPDLTMPAPTAVFQGGAVAQIPPPPVVVQASAVSTASSPPFAPVAPHVVAQSGGVEKDARGFPWDPRIHSSSRNKNANGTWRAKKGMNDGGTLIAKVEAELTAVMAVPGPVAPSASVVFGTTGATPVVPPPPPPGVVDQTLSFPGLMTALTPAMAAGRINTALLTEACVAVGIPSLPLLATRPDLVPAVHDWLKARVQL